MVRRPGLRRRLLLVLTAAAAGLAGSGAPVAQAQPDRAPARGQLSGGAAVVLLHRAVEASGSLAYSGTQVLSTWGAAGATSGVVSVTHLPGTGTVMGVAPTVAGPGGVMLDDGLLGHDREIAQLEVRRLETARLPLSSPAATRDLRAGDDLDDTVLSLLRRHYDLVEAAPASALGRPCHVVEARRPGADAAGAVAGRFWLDRATGLVLRRESYDEQGALMRSSSFIDLELGPTGTGAATTAGGTGVVLPTVGASVGDRVPEGSWTRLVDDGFWMAQALPGGMDLHDVRARVEGRERVLHLAYSDGLSTLSVFQQRGRLDEVPPPGWETSTLGGFPVLVRTSPPQRVVWESGDVVFTLLGDPSPAALAEVVATLPHDRPGSDDGIRARLSRGLARVGGFLNPFD